jgi:hypothetical protein
VCIIWTNKEFDIVNARCNHEDHEDEARNVVSEVGLNIFCIMYVHFAGPSGRAV